MRWIFLGLLLLPPVSRAANPTADAGPTIILPDGRGILDLAAAQDAADFDAIPNPFRARSVPAPPAREVTLVIHSILIADRPENASVVVNGQLYSPGDVIEGLKLARIAVDGLELRGEDVVVRVPVQDAPPKLRLRPQ